MWAKWQKRTKTGHPQFHSRWAANNNHLIHSVDITRFFLPTETTALIKDLILSLPLPFYSFLSLMGSLYFPPISIHCPNIMWMKAPAPGASRCPQ